MPSSHRKKRSVYFEKSPRIPGEVTLNDFANSEIPKGCKGRIKKSVSNELMLAKMNMELDPLKEMMVDDPTDEVKTGRRRRRRKSSSTSSKDDDINTRPGIIYPLDLWFLLSDYIAPQYVLKFSLICKGSYHVVNTSKFWINLYKRYCRTKSVRAKFEPLCCEKRHGLKPSVVQALFLAYPSLNHSPKVENVTSVSGFICILMWIERTGLSDIQDSVNLNSSKNWIYKFKLSKKGYKPGTGAATNDNRLKYYCDINANPDDGCKILTVPCREYTAVPCVSGMRLNEVISSSKLLSLVFSSSPHNSSNSQMGNISIRLRPSQGPTLFDWWHPSYYKPQSQTS